MNFKKLINKKKKGFTLIEMVMVVVILGILSSMAMMKYDQVQENAKLKTDYATAATIATATTMAINDNKNISGTVDIKSVLVDGNYLQSDVKCNTTDADFKVTVSEKGFITVTSTKEGSKEETFYPREK